MWLLPYLSAISGVAVRLYYRASRGGEAVPRSGPVLLVANHPNSLLDPAFVAWAARRPVRFLAKAPLFTDRRVGWLVRGSGALPVYRPQDDARLIYRNLDTFRAVHEALGQGAAIAIFPEGVSHSEPALVPLKTGAARIALGAAAAVGSSFPIVPIGLIFRAKDRFRSEAHVIVGEPVPWDDLSASGTGDAEAVRALTARIEQHMRAVTLNLARWEDEPVIRAAEAIWAVERNAERTPAAKLARLGAASDALAQLRASRDQRWAELADAVLEHVRTLHAFGLRPADVPTSTSVGRAAKWVLRRLHVTALAQAALATLAVLLFWIPYRVTGALAASLTRHRDTVSTYRVLGGLLVFGLWIAVLATAVGARGGWLAGLVAALALPAIAVAGLYAAERWRRSLAEARRWMALRRSATRAAVLRERQAQLAKRLDEALAAHAGADV